MSKTKIAINGFGRIGRLAFKQILAQHSEELEVVAINDLGDVKILAHLLKYDSSYGIYDKKIFAEKGEISVDGQKIKFFSERNPENLPWGELGIKIVIESTGVFRDYEGAKKHLDAGAEMVVISAPSKSPDKIPTYVLGVNAGQFNPKNDKIVDMGSCTTNCLAPVAKILDREFGIEKAFLTTVHSYTNDQRILDLPHKDLRRARAAGLNIIPTTTGAAKAVERCLPQLKGRMNGIALRVPTATVSIIDFTAILGKKTTAEEINYTLKKASEEEEMRGILGVEDALLVSSDYKGNSFSSVVDSSLTDVVGGNLAKVLAWYDNEWGYSTRLADFAGFISGRMK